MAFQMDSPKTAKAKKDWSAPPPLYEDLFPESGSTKTEEETTAI
jgi:hypothetical protein